MSHYYNMEINGTKYSISLSIPEEPTEEWPQDAIDRIHSTILEVVLPDKLEKLGVDKADRVWIEDTAGNLIREVQL